MRRSPRGGCIVAEKARVRRKQPARATSLGREQAVYDAHLPRWVPDHEGKHVLIKDDEVVGFFDSRDDALAAGYARFGVGPLFVKQVSPSEPVHHIPGALL
jgi:hypothetical protein